MFFLPIVFLSCKKEYKYEVWAKTGLFSNLTDIKESEDIIKESDDSTAFVSAHLKFIISMQTRWKYTENFHPEIYYYKLIDPEGNDIASGSFLSNPDDIRKFHTNAFLTTEFKEYLRSKDAE